MTSGALTVSTIKKNSDVFEDNLPDESELEFDRDIYRAAAGWVIFINSVALITQTIMATISKLYHGKCFKKRFVTFALVVSLSRNSICDRDSKMDQMGTQYT